MIGLNVKKVISFYLGKERAEILNNINFVDEVIDFNDQDNTAIDAIEKCLCIYDKVVFANGGDRQSGNVPEYDFFKKIIMLNLNMELEEIKKLNSSSWILDEFINKNINIDKKYYDSSTQYVKKAP